MAVILAGGKSSRTGAPRFLLRSDGEPLIAPLVRRSVRRIDDVVVAAALEQELPALPARIVRDELPYRGPSGGICYGLRAAVEDV